MGTTGQRAPVRVSRASRSVTSSVAVGCDAGPCQSVLAHEVPQLEAAVACTAPLSRPHPVTTGVPTMRGGTRQRSRERPETASGWGGPMQGPLSLSLGVGRDNWRHIGRAVRSLTDRRRGEPARPKRTRLRFSGESTTRIIMDSSISWAAVFAGVVVGLIAQLLLTMLGTGMGLAAAGGACRRPTLAPVCSKIVVESATHAARSACPAVADPHCPGGGSAQHEHTATLPPAAQVV